MRKGSKGEKRPAVVIGASGYVTISESFSTLEAFDRMDASGGFVIAGRVLVHNSARMMITPGAYERNVLRFGERGFGLAALVIGEKDFRPIVHKYAAFWLDPRLAAATQNVIREQIALVVTKDGANGPFADRMRLDWVQEASRHSGRPDTVALSVHIFPIDAAGKVEPWLTVEGGHNPGRQVYSVRMPGIAKDEAAFAVNVASFSRVALGLNHLQVLPSKDEAFNFAGSRGVVGVVSARDVMDHGAEAAIAALQRHNIGRDGPLVVCR